MVLSIVFCSVRSVVRLYCRVTRERSAMDSKDLEEILESKAALVFLSVLKLCTVTAVHCLPECFSQYSVCQFFLHL